MILSKSLPSILKSLGLSFLLSIVNIIRDENRKEEIKTVLRILIYPLLAITVFLFFWFVSAKQIETSLGNIPSPLEVVDAAEILWDDHVQERSKERVFFEKQELINDNKLKDNPSASVSVRAYTGKPTYIDQIYTSLFTVFVGFLLASIIAVPLGILTGMSKSFMSALNPLIQIFKPVSPLAWLPIVTIIVSALYKFNDGFFEKSFIISAITVSLCCLWPTLINTSLGVQSVEKDHLNLAKAFRLSLRKKIIKIILPSAMPTIFAGLRISLGIGWMVLIATEMLAQNPGLGKFVWDEFQNGSSTSLAKIFVAVFTIGIVGFFLDRMMILLQELTGFKSYKSNF